MTATGPVPGVPLAAPAPSEVGAPPAPPTPGRDHRSGPRRRGPALRSAIVTAVLAELSDVGYEAFTIDAVAARAKISKGSVYRRWTGKADLVFDIIHSVLPPPDEPPDTGTLRGDLIATLDYLAQTLQGPAGSALKGLLSDTLRDDRAAEAFRARSRGSGPRAIAAIVRRAVSRGDLPTTQIPVQRLGVAHAMLRQEFLLRRDIDPHFVITLVDTVILPLLRAPADPSPARPDGPAAGAG